jgi:hypothetical protein
MIRQLCRAIMPPLTLASAIQNWAGISSDLSESPRRRKLQNEGIEELLQGLPLS